MFSKELCARFQAGKVSIGLRSSALLDGIVPGVMLAVVLSMLWLLSVAARPPDAVLGRAPGVKGFHDLKDYPDAKTIPGLLLYRFGGNVVFSNADYFKERLLAAVVVSETPVKWVVLDASPISIVDAMAMQKFDELRAELKTKDIVLAVARARMQLRRYFRPEWFQERDGLYGSLDYPTVKSAVRAFEKRAEGTPAQYEMDASTAAREDPHR